MKGVRIRSYSGPQFPAFELNLVWMRENVDHDNSEYGHFLRSVVYRYYSDTGSFRIVHIFSFH